MKIRKRKRRIPDRRSEGSKKEIGGKQNNSRSIKERGQEVFRPDKFSTR